MEACTQRGAAHSPKTVLLTRVPERTPVQPNVSALLPYSFLGAPLSMSIGTVCRDCGKRLA
jgi:hypothetical protein